MTEPLITKFRPISFDDELLIGHREIIAALRRVIASPTRPHAYLFTGPSGIGKTTLARIVASEIGAEVLEFDAASNSSVEAARQLVELGQYRSLGGSDSKMFLIDEFHGLSRQAMDALLKTIEEPPEHLYFALCTTEAHRVRETIVTRCYHVPLKPLRDAEVEELVSLVCVVEDWKPDGDVVQMVVQAATGQPRKALSMLQSVHDAPSREEARRVIALLDTSEPVTDLLRDIVGGKRSWSLLRGHLEKLGDEDFDSLVAEASGYIATVIVREGDEARARSLWQLLDALTFPSATYNKRAAFVAAVGRMLWGGQ